METSDHQILDCSFVLHGPAHVARFFERMDRSYEGTPAEASSLVHVHVHPASPAELVEAVTDWGHRAAFHRSLNYAAWNLHGPAEPGGIFLPEQGLLFRFTTGEDRLDVYVDQGRAQRADELIFHAARNLALWRRGEHLRPMLHASAIDIDGMAWLFLGSKGAGKSTLFIDSVLRQHARPLANDRVLLDRRDGRSVWSWPSYLSYCEGTLVDYPELRQVFDATAGTGSAARARLYRRSYAQAHKRITPPFHFHEVLGRRYRRSARIGGAVVARLEPGHAGGLSVLSQHRSADLTPGDLADAVFPHDDPDFADWHRATPAADPPDQPIDQALDWLRAANVPFLRVVLDPVLGKSALVPLLMQHNLPRSSNHGS